MSHEIKIPDEPPLPSSMESTQELILDNKSDPIIIDSSSDTSQPENAPLTEPKTVPSAMDSIQYVGHANEPDIMTNNSSMEEHTHESEEDLTSGQTTPVTSSSGAESIDVLEPFKGETTTGNGLPQEILGPNQEADKDIANIQYLFNTAQGTQGLHLKLSDATQDSTDQDVTEKQGEEEEADEDAQQSYTQSA